MVLLSSISLPSLAYDFLFETFILWVPQYHIIFSFLLLLLHLYWSFSHNLNWTFFKCFHPVFCSPPLKFFDAESKHTVTAYLPIWTLFQHSKLDIFTLCQWTTTDNLSYSSIKDFSTRKLKLISNHVTTWLCALDFLLILMIKYFSSHII